MKLFFTLLLCLFTQIVNAEVTVTPNNSGCSCLTASKANTQYTLMQQTFADDSQELVIAEGNENLPAKIHQVTFGSKSTKTPSPNSCFFIPLAFNEGGSGPNFWGWHLLWAEPTGLFYARMDGEAWVSSVPKRLSKLVTRDTQFKQENTVINITWQQTEDGLTTKMQAVSQDEGRSWDISTY